MHFGKMTSTQRKCKGVDQKLILQPYSKACPGGGTGHHLIPGRCMRGQNYDHSAAPVICVKGTNQHTGSHRACHRVFDPVERWYFSKKKDFRYKKAKEAAAKSAGGALTPKRRLTKKEQDCIKAQLDEYYKKDPPGLTENTKLKASGARGKVNELFPKVQSSGGGIPSVVG
jgi:hypothetical protein